jgi:hypothetical protein
MISRDRTTLRHVEEALVLDGHRVRLWFDDDTVGELDIAKHIRFRGVLEPLRDLEYFRRVKVEAGTLCWPNEVDLDPCALYEAAVPVTAPRPPRKPESAPPGPLAPGADTSLAEISRFFGIVICMFFREHSPPHFHLSYGEYEASIEIESLALLHGRVPPRALALTIEWAMLHRAELRANWDRARRGESFQKIAPLE